MEANTRSLPDQRCSSVSPPCSSKSLNAFGPNTSRYYLLFCSGFIDDFFCIPLHPKSQPFFAFVHPKKKVWTDHLDCPPPGIQSPYLFGLSLTQDLAEWQYPQATLIQYVDDLLLCGPNKPVISWATDSLLNFLADRGYKISKEKAQLCQSRVTYLGLFLEKEISL
jgi:hypothetical protein